jgi:acyl-CoA thioester hydrolase
MTRIPPSRTLQTSYPCVSPVIARYADVDPYWHLNNVAIATYFEDARITFVAGLLEIDRLTGARSRVLLARLAIDYLREGRWPGTLQVGAGVTTVGRTSVTVGLGLFQDEACIAVSDAVLVRLGEAGPAPWLDDERTALSDPAWGLRAG